MTGDASASSERRLLELGGVAGGTVLFAPVVYRVFAAALDVLTGTIGVSASNWVEPDGLVAIATFLALCFVTVPASLALARYSLRGSAALRAGRSAVALVPIGSLLVFLLALAVLAVEGFLEAFRWGVSEGDTLVTALGLLGLLAVAWVVTRSSRAFLAGVEQVR